MISNSTMSQEELEKTYNEKISKTESEYNESVNIINKSFEDVIFDVTQNSLKRQLNIDKQIEELKAQKNHLKLKEKADIKFYRNNYANEIKKMKSDKDTYLQKLKIKFNDVLQQHGHKSLSLSKRKTIPAPLKRDCWNKWIGPNVAHTYCLCCNQHKISMNDFEAGHVISDAEGGELSVDNLKPICSKCNKSMGKKNMNDFIKECGYDKRFSLFGFKLF